MPFTKKDGVPLTPLRTPLMKSPRTFSAKAPDASASRKSIGDSFRFAASAMRSGTLNRGWLAKID